MKRILWVILIIAAVKINGQPRQLLRREGSAGDIVGAAVDTILTIK